MCFYELSNEQTIVRYVRRVNMPACPLFGRREPPTFGEYRRSILALLAVIRARTGLSPSDLSPSTEEKMKRPYKADVTLSCANGSLALHA